MAMTADNAQAPHAIIWGSTGKRYLRDRTSRSLRASNRNALPGAVPGLKLGAIRINAPFRRHRAATVNLIGDDVSLKHDYSYG